MLNWVRSSESICRYAPFELSQKQVAVCPSRF